jgi:hypothetical protein
MHTERINVLNKAYCNHVAFAVAYYLKLKLLSMLRKTSNAFWWVALGALAAGVGGRILWEITLFGWNLPPRVFHWTRALLS